MIIRTKLNIKIRSQIIIDTKLLSITFNTVIISSITIKLIPGSSVNCYQVM